MEFRKPMVAGNWKMNGESLVNEVLLAALRVSIDRSLTDRVDVAVCPPFPYLAQAARGFAGTAVSWGAQDVAAWDEGAYTGEVSAAMLDDFGCSWAIVGHSERRTLMGETDDLVARKAARALAAGIGAIVCVGETLGDRELDRTEEVVGRQLAALGELAAGADPSRFVVAYEPVWAIGTGRTASPEQAQAVHAFIRGRLAAAGCARADQVRILYGGSVKASNAANLFAMDDIDGGLIGGAALVAEEFTTIVRAAANAGGMNR